MNKLYHYTSIETLYNMLEKSIFIAEDPNVHYLKMWATHIMYLNDETERKLFTDMLIKEVVNYSNTKTPLNGEQMQRLHTLCNLDSFIISLSEHQDNLNMWRGYGGNGIGANIEFDFNSISSFYSTSKQNTFMMENVYRPLKCKYFQPGHCDLGTSLIQRTYDCCIDDKDINDVKQVEVIKKIQELATIFKHKAYEEEKEWRFVINSCSLSVGNRYYNGIIKPYVEFSIPLSAITAITIGPCIKENYSIISISQFIKRKLGSNVEVKYSQIPYRS